MLSYQAVEAPSAVSPCCTPRRMPAGSASTSSTGKAAATIRLIARPIPGREGAHRLAAQITPAPTAVPAQRATDNPVMGVSAPLASAPGGPQSAMLTASIPAPAAAPVAASAAALPGLGSPAGTIKCTTPT